MGCQNDIGVDGEETASKYFGLFSGCLIVQSLYFRDDGDKKPLCIRCLQTSHLKQHLKRWNLTVEIEYARIIELINLNYK